MLELPLTQSAAFARLHSRPQYKRAARELWKFCWLADAGAGVELTARLLRDIAAQDDAVDWWQRGVPRERGRERS